MRNLKLLTELCGGKVTHRNRYPGWEYQGETPLLQAFCNAYGEVYGKKPQTIALHAGLECGLLGQKLPGLDCVSIGPEMHDIHTSRERLGIASVERTWEFILEILKEL